MSTCLLESNLDADSICLPDMLHTWSVQTNHCKFQLDNNRMLKLPSALRSFPLRTECTMCDSPHRRLIGMYRLGKPRRMRLTTRHLFHSTFLVSSLNTRSARIRPRTRSTFLASKQYKCWVGLHPSLDSTAHWGTPHTCPL